jgi:hypothetical protein
LRIVPGSEVVELALDLLGPALGCVGEEREVLVRLGGLVRSRLAVRLTDGDCSFLAVAQALGCDNIAGAIFDT